MLNQIVLQGRLTRDPEISRPDYSSTNLAHFSLAVDRDVKTKEGDRKTDFINCHAWGPTAEFAGKYFKKGQMAVVVGRLEVQSYTDKEGNKRQSASVRVGSMYFGDSKKDGQAPAAPTAPSPAPYPATGEFADISDEDDGDLPF